MSKICSKCGRKIGFGEYSYNGECEECHKNRNCRRCGKEVIGSQSNNGYCEECYHIVQEEKTKVYCPNCGKETQIDANVCYNCGVNPKNIKNIKFCPHCGKPVNAEQVICLNCKQSLGKEDNTESASGGIILICFLFPIIGLFIYIANASTKEEYANSCGRASIAGFITGLILGGTILLLVADKFNW